MSIKCFSCKTECDLVPNTNYAICTCGRILFSESSVVYEIVDEIDKTIEKHRKQWCDLQQKKYNDSVSTTIEENEILDKTNYYISLRTDILNLYKGKEAEKKDELGIKLYELRQVTNEIIEFFNRSKE